MAARLLALFLCFSLIWQNAVAQQPVKGVVADDITHKPLPFATIKHANSRQGIVTDIYGRFSFTTTASELEVSYIGYETKTVPVKDIDTVFLSPASSAIGEVVITPPYEKIKRILNLAIANKDRHNPDKYDWYSCNIYYKMSADMLPTEQYFKNDTSKEGFRKFTENNHLVFSETYNKRVYKKPGKLQDIVIASRFSGLKKTYFTNLVTGIIPFHIYDEEISLIGNEYLHPVAKGWQSRYEFDLVDELQDGTDTIFILKYKPQKGVTFKSLKGMVFINSDGYAISHFTGTAEDTSSGRQVNLEQIYTRVDNRWFPHELNYEFIFRKYPNPEMGIMATGHSVVDSVSFAEAKSFRFDKTRTVILTDSIDDRTDEEWNAYRNESLTRKEQNTYRVIDSLAEKAHITDALDGLTNLHMGRFPVKSVDIELQRLFAINPIEQVRLGLGLYTNDRVSRYFSIGGWFGYGFRDKIWKYGGSLRTYPFGHKNTWLEIAYRKDYRSSGIVSIHPDIDPPGFRRLLLQQADLAEDIALTYHDRFGFFEADFYAKHQTLTAQNSYDFKQPGSNDVFNVIEGGINLRYAYGEKRTPLFGYYIPAGTRYPVVYLLLGAGEIKSGIYTGRYVRPLAAFSYEVHTNRWGKDNFLLTAGMMISATGQPIPKSYLLAANGIRMRQDFQLYQRGGFLTMLPNEYYSDRYLSLFYKHDFDKRFYNLDYSQPFLSVVYNVVYGDVSPGNAVANPDIQSPGIYHEPGIMLNDIIRMNYLNVAYLGFSIGYFYHVSDAAFDHQRHGRFALGTSVRF